MTRPDQRIVLVAAVADNGVIGTGDDIPWHLPEDLAHFRRTTEGNVVVMGRRTYDTIGRPLPRRTNVVVTRQPGWQADGVLVAGSWEQAVAIAAEHQGDVMVIGGAEIYALAMPHADVQVLSEVHLTPEGDVRYPDFDRSSWQETAREQYDGFDVVRLERHR